jgi:hypothetical protein
MPKAALLNLLLSLQLLIAVISIMPDIKKATNPCERLAKSDRSGKE